MTDNTVLDPDDAALVFKANGQIELLMPRHKRDALVADNMLAATEVLTQFVCSRSVASLAADFKARSETGERLQ